MSEPVLVTRELKRRAPEFLTLFYATAGAPDREIVGNNVTTRWEFKHATPFFDSPANQELECMRLAKQGHCRYVLWAETAAWGQHTLIVHPKEVHGRGPLNFIRTEARCKGFDMGWLVDYVLEQHNWTAYQRTSLGSYMLGRD